MWSQKTKKQQNKIDMGQFKTVCNLITAFYTSFRAYIHQPLLSHFSLLVEFFIGTVPVHSRDSRVFRLANLTPDVLANSTLLSSVNSRKVQTPIS